MATGTAAGGRQRLLDRSRLFALASVAGAAWVFGPYLVHGNLLGCLGLVLGLLLIVVIHEAGHLLAGRLVGFRWALIAIGPLQVTQTVRGHRYSLNKAQLFGGGVLCLPAGEDRRLRRHSLITSLGGLAANTAIALVGFSAALAMLFVPGVAHFQTVYGSAYSHATVALDPTAALFWQALVGFSSLSLAAAIVNAIPFRFSGFSTDGMKVVELLAGGSRARRLCALEQVAGAELIEFQRPRDWKESWIQDALSHPDPTYSHILANRLAYLWALDRGEVEAAGTFLGQVLAEQGRVPKGVLPAFRLEAAYFTAHYGGDARTARTWLEQAGNKSVDAHSWFRAQAAVLLAEGERIEARESASRGLAALENASHAGRVLAEADWLRDIIHSADAPSLEPGA
jgi:hypothetical protein